MRLTPHRPWPGCAVDEDDLPVDEDDESAEQGLPDEEADDVLDEDDAGVADEFPEDAEGPEAD